MLSPVCQHPPAADAANQPTDYDIDRKRIAFAEHPSSISAMSVYTELNQQQFDAILSSYRLGTLNSFEGIAAGIENSNFFIDTTTGRYVLTIFERMEADELPYFMRLMKHLATQGVACPDVMQRNDGNLLFEVAGKQGCIVSCLSGETLDQLNTRQLNASGRALAELHIAGSAFSEHRDNPTGMGWLQEKCRQVLEKTRSVYGEAVAALLSDEIDFQQSCDWSALPAGVIHGDLFVDNILFEDDTVSGIIDFYYAHDAPYAMDLAISINAQAVLLGPDDRARIHAFLDGYCSVRPLEEEEQRALPLLLRLAALRFWVSRLYDAFFPRGGAMTQTKEPEEYRRKLQLHRTADD